MSEDEKRIQLFNLHTYRCKKEAGYICSICLHPTTLSESYSSRGINLVCKRCFNRLCETIGMEQMELLSLIFIKGEQMRTELKEDIDDE